MGTMFRTLIALVVLVLVPSSASAWGFVAHRFIMARAIELLPPEIKPFFLRHRDEIVIRVIDPDLWRTVGWEDDPNHFLDFGVGEYGRYPFTALPREYGAALEKFGAAALDRNGRLPWRQAEMFGHLRRTFEAHKGTGQYAVNDTILFAAVMSHYVQDAHQPLHATDNYDGQLTGQRGVHSRFERDLFERFQARLSINPPAVVAVTNPRDAAFETLLASYQLVEAVLKADKEAIAAKDTYDNEYFEKFFANVRPILEKRLSEAIAKTAGLIVGAWQQAGRPALRIQDTRPVEKVSRPSVPSAK